MLQPCQLQATEALPGTMLVAITVHTLNPEPHTLTSRSREPESNPRKQPQAMRKLASPNCTTERSSRHAPLQLATHTNSSTDNGSSTSTPRDDITSP